MPDYTSILSFNDLIGVPLVFIFFAVSLYWTLPYFIKSKEYRQLFYIGIGIKIIGVTVSFIFYNYIEKYADTQTYFSFGKTISNIISDYPISESGKVFYTDFDDLPMHMKSLFNPYFDQEVFRGNTVIIRIVGAVLFLTFNSYIACSLVFSFFGYIGCWLIFKTFSARYPQFKNYFYFFIILYPPVFFWTSGVLKEPICIGCLGVIFSLFFNIGKDKKGILVKTIAVVVSMLLLYQIKSYLLITLLVAFLIAFLFYLINQVQNKKYQYILFASVALSSVGVIAYLLLGLQNFLSTDNALEVLNRIDITTSYQLSAGNSNYDLGKLELTGAGLFKYVLASINAGLFRPFIFEIKKIQLFLSGLDSLLMLLMLIYLIFKKNFIETLKRLKNQPILIFCLVFILLLAAEIGAISFNYGTLIRYKTPLMPFYFSLIIILLSKNKYLNSQPVNL